MEHNINNKPLAKILRKNMTPWERKLWYCFLKEYPVRFQRQKCIDNYIVDFYCFRAKIIVELDGGGHYNLISQQKDNKNFYGVCTVIDEEVKKRISDSPRHG